MKIYIPTRGRNTSSTFDALPSKWKKEVIFVRDDEDKSMVKMMEGGKIVWGNFKGISDKRQFILEHAVKNGHKKIVMMDDDLVFAHRTNGVLKPSIPFMVSYMLEAIEDGLEDYTHIGVSPREGNNREVADYTEIGRMMRILAYRPKRVLDLGCRFDRVKVMEDFDMTLQLLRKGEMNSIIWTYTHDQKKSNADGGCSLWRTNDLQHTEAKKLASLHPGFVKIVQKTTKGKWGSMGTTRTDVRIAWKKAYESSQ